MQRVEAGDQPVEEATAFRHAFHKNAIHRRRQPDQAQVFGELGNP
jgi:hypothetical protein